MQPEQESLVLARARAMLPATATPQHVAEFVRQAAHLAYIDGATLVGDAVDDYLARTLVTVIARAALGADQLRH